MDLRGHRGPLIGGLLIVAGVLATTPRSGPALASPVDGPTLGDADGDGVLGWQGPSERVIRTELAMGAIDLDADRTRLLTFAQLTDMHVVDEESPLRTEFLDPWMGTAYRPQDGLTPHVLERMTATIQRAVSPVSGVRAELVITTGDNSDTGQRNEVRWFIDLLDGGLIEPDSGIPGTCGQPAAAPRYHGVRGAEGYYEPDGPADGRGYASAASLNAATIGRRNQLADHPGLFERMNEPFSAGGVGVPWYTAFGDHDALVQGNAPLDGSLAMLAAGCRKVIALPDEALSTIHAAAEQGGRDAMLAGAFAAMGDPAIASLAVGDTGTAPPAGGVNVSARQVDADQARIPLDKRGFIEEHFRTSGTPVGHGFGAWNRGAGEGYYAFAPSPGIRFIVLDSVNEAGGHNGNIDEAQFQWLHAQLLDAGAKREVVLAFAHHTLATLLQPAPGAHLGLGPSGAVQACATAHASADPGPDESLRCLFLRHPALIAFVTGHEHRNHIGSHARPEAPGLALGGFWEITTASHIEWPQQSRLIDLFDGGDHMVIATTMLDHDADAHVAPGAPLDDTATLARIAREISFNDPQARNGHDGTSDPGGTPADRDTELIVPDPWASGTER